MLEDHALRAAFDEMMESPLIPRRPYEALCRTLGQLSADELQTRHTLAQSDFLRQGITFTVYNDQLGTERPMPFDCIPKIVSVDEWKVIELGLIQRVKALNAFLDDIYTEQVGLHDGVVPRHLVVNSPHFHHQVAGIQLPRQDHVFLSGIDLIRNEQGEYLVLEDNLRNPSGLAYVFQNRYVMRKVYPELFRGYSVRSLATHFRHLLTALQSLDVREKSDSVVVLLTPGAYNSAYYEHSFLAQQLGIELVEGRDLQVIDRMVYMKTARGLRKVDVIYRRINDEFLDPLVFRPDSLLGVAGLVDAVRAGNVALANGIGNGVADDKATYRYVPKMIEYYLGEKPILQGVPTYELSRPDEREFVLAHIEEMVVKQTDSSGGYNMLIGPHASDLEIERFRTSIAEHPERYIAQPTVQLSQLPTYVDGELAPRHVDLRAFVIGGSNPSVFTGGLARVALRKGSLVVNSSQGGGGKDTWVLSNEFPPAEAAQEVGL